MTFCRREVLRGSVTLGAAAILGAATAPTKDRPNILWIVSEDNNLNRPEIAGGPNS